MSSYEKRRGRKENRGQLVCLKKGKRFEGEGKLTLLESSFGGEGLALTPSRWSRIQRERASKGVRWLSMSWLRGRRCRRIQKGTEEESQRKTRSRVFYKKIGRDRCPTRRDRAREERYIQAWLQIMVFLKVGRMFRWSVSRVRDDVHKRERDARSKRGGEAKRWVCC